MQINTWMNKIYRDVSSATIRHHLRLFPFSISTSTLITSSLSTSTASIIKSNPTVESKRLRLIIRQQCSLCIPAAFIAQKISNRYNVTLECINLDSFLPSSSSSNSTASINHTNSSNSESSSQQSLHELYTDHVPVLLLNDIELARHRLNEPAITAALDHAGIARRITR